MCGVCEATLTKTKDTLRQHEEQVQIGFPFAHFKPLT